MKHLEHEVFLNQITLLHASRATLTEPWGKVVCYCYLCSDERPHPLLKRAGSANIPNFA